MIHGETSHAISIKRCKCMSGWMDGCGLLLEAMVFSLESSLSLFFWVMLLWHTIFSLFGATIIWFYFIAGMFYERDYQDMENLLMENGWIVVLIPNVGMSQMDESCTCWWSRKHEKHLTRVIQFDKTQQNIKEHMGKGFSWNMTYGSGRTLHITGELAFLDFQKQLQILSITGTNLHNLIYHIWTHNNLDLDQAYATHRTFRFISKIFA